jgi:benzoyl-CoA reductase/2-hydroxyglutaryl-CoA dehydratase subunit BcrC/BadD/HgdB
MNNPEQSELNMVRFDSELKSFNHIATLLTNSSERIKKSGKKVIAKSPFCPAEPIYAAGALAYNPYIHEVIRALKKDKNNLISKATDVGLSPDSNPWNLIMSGAVVSGQNEVAIDAYSVACGFWDDQISNAWQLMAEATKKPLYFWEVPRFDSSSTKWAIKFLTTELEQFFDWLTDQTGNSITEQGLMESIKSGNLIKQDLKEISQMVQLRKVPIPALEYYITQTMINEYVQDPKMLHNTVITLIQELKERESKNITPASISEKPVRIYFMGEEISDIRIWNEIEDYGGVIVGYDRYLSLIYEPIKEDGSAIENMAQWIYKMLCNMPTAQRIQKTIPIIKQQEPDVVIISSNVGSKIIPESELLIHQIIEDEIGIPIFSLENEQPFMENGLANEKLKSFIKSCKDKSNRG